MRLERTVSYAKSAADVAKATNVAKATKRTKTSGGTKDAKRPKRNGHAHAAARPSASHAALAALLAAPSSPVHPSAGWSPSGQGAARHAPQPQFIASGELVIAPVRATVEDKASIDAVGAALRLQHGRRLTQPHVIALLVRYALQEPERFLAWASEPAVTR